jgi:hypothetical protein
VPLLQLDAGGFSNFYSNDGSIRGRAIIDVFSKIGVGAVNLSSRELAGNPASLDSLSDGTQIPFLSANIVNQATGKPYYTPSLKLKAGNLTIGIVGICDRSPNEWSLNNGSGKLVTSDPVQAAAPVVASLSKECDLVILLAAVQARNLPDMLKGLPGVGLVLGADGYTTSFQPFHYGDVYASFSGNQGKRLGVLELKLRNGKITAIEQKHTLLNPSYPEDPDVKAIVEAANKEIEKLSLSEDAKRRQLLEKVNPDYLGYTACRGCHREAYDAWRKTKHFTAFNPVVNTKKIGDAFCLRCHTTGYGYGGFIDISLTPRMAHVQCEACHGPGGKHAKDPNNVKTSRVAGEKGCLACHDKDNSPNFDFKAYWTKIAH